jgi:hypothetical protein
LFEGVGWDEPLGAAVDDLLHLLLVPVAGVGDHDVGCVGDPGAIEIEGG